MSKDKIRSGLIAAGVKNLKQFGYTSVTEATILTDAVYKAFFRSMLEQEDNVGVSREIEAVRQELLKEVTGGS